MDSRSKLAIILGVVILVVDLLWLSGSFSRYGAIGGRGLPYRNYTGNPNATGSGYNGTGMPFHAGYPGYLDIVYGLIILVADVIWLYLEFSMTRTPAKKK